MSAPALAGRRAVVTGGGRGIGAAIAAALADAGASVVVAARSGVEIERVVGQLRDRGARANAVSCDVTDEASVQRLGEQAREQLGGVDLLVNNAGDAASSPLAKISLADWNRMLAVFMRRRSVIDTSFTMDVGETVVVGTSRMRGGDKALIALLTAVPRTK